MKNIIILAIGFFFLPYLSVAQDNDQYGKRFSFGYNYGSSIAKGAYGMNNTSKLPISRLTKQDTTELNGYAKTGFHYDIYFTYEFIPHLSAMLAVSGDQSNYDINTLATQYYSFFAPNTRLATTGDNYYIVQYLIGPYLNPRIVGNLHFELKVLVGLTTANYPGISYIIEPNLQVANYTNYIFQKGSAFGYNIGGGFNYGAVIGPIGLGAHLNLNYEGSTVTYPGYSITNYTGSNVQSSNYNIPKTMVINILQLTVGLSIEI